MSALEKALKEFRDRQESLAASQVKDAATKVRPASRRPTTTRLRLWQGSVQTLGLASLLRKATQFHKGGQAATRRCRCAEEAGGQARAQGRAGPRARARPRRGRGRGAGRRGQGLADRAADQVWRAAQQAAQGGAPSNRPETEHVVPHMEALRAGPRWSRSLGAHHAIEASPFL